MTLNPVKVEDGNGKAKSESDGHTTDSDQGSTQGRARDSEPRSDLSRALQKISAMAQEDQDSCE